MGPPEIAGDLSKPGNDESKPIRSAAPEEVPVDTNDEPIPPDKSMVFQGGNFLLMLLAACYFAAEIILPIVLAFVLMLVLQPAMRLLVERWHVPRGAAALALIVMLIGTLAGLGTALSGPAA